MEKPSVAPVRKDTVQSEDAREKQVRGSALDTSTPWARCAEELWKHEKDVIQDLKEGIDTLLLFAGLFSAVVTAFNVEFYKTLQPQPTDSTAQILMHISAQLSSFAVNSGFINSTVPGYPTRYPEPVSQLDIATNTLWFSALVISLAAASIGITIKQWLSNHVAGVPLNPRQSATAWYLRHTGFDRWRVEDIVNLMPILLQVALMLFLVGLVLQFWKTSLAVACAILGQMVILLSFAFGTAITPSLSPHSPYKSPMSRGFYRLFRSCKVRFGKMRQYTDDLHKRLRSRRRSSLPDSMDDKCLLFSEPIEPLPSWDDREESELNNIMQTIEPVVVLDAAFQTLKGDFVDRVLQPFLRLAPVEVGLPIFEHYISKPDITSTAAIGHMAIDLLTNLHSQEVLKFDSNERRSRLSKIAPTPLSSYRIRIVNYLQGRLTSTQPSERLLYDNLLEYYKTLNFSSENRLYLLQLLTRHVARFRFGDELAYESMNLGDTAVDMLSDVSRNYPTDGAVPYAVLTSVLDCLKHLLRFVPAHEPSVYLNLIELLGSIDVPRNGITPGSVRKTLGCVLAFSAYFKAGCEGIPDLLSLFVKLQERRKIDDLLLLRNVAKCILRHVWRASSSEICDIRNAVLSAMVIDSVGAEQEKPSSPAGHADLGFLETDEHDDFHISGEEGWETLDSGGVDSKMTLDVLVRQIRQLVLLPEQQLEQIDRTRKPEDWAVESAQSLGYAPGAGANSEDRITLSVCITEGAQTVPSSPQHGEHAVPVSSLVTANSVAVGLV